MSPNRGDCLILANALVYGYSGMTPQAMSPSARFGIIPEFLTTSLTILIVTLLLPSLSFLLIRSVVSIVLSIVLITIIRFIRPNSIVQMENERRQRNAATPQV